MEQADLQESAAAAAGAAIYTKPILAVYDLGVLGFSNTFIWRCPSRHILDLYNRHVSAKHLDVGVGTGYFLDRCAFPTANPAITLLDLNTNSLDAAARRVERYAPATCHADVLQRIPLPEHGFDSIGLTYVLHCLPGPFSVKARAFDNLVRLLAPGGVVFGTTILCKGIDRSLPARLLMAYYNRHGVFSNEDDGLDELTDALKANFRTAAVRVIGCVAFFVGHV